MKGCNLTQHGSKRQIKMFKVRFILGKNLSLLWHVKSVSSLPTFWKVVNWLNMVPKGKLKCSWLRFTLGENISLVWHVKSISSQPTGCKLTQQGSKRQIKMLMVRFTWGKNLSLVWPVKSVSSQPTFWKVVTWHNMVPKDKLKCSWLDSLWEKIFHLYDM